MEQEEIISLQELCRLLSVSEATGRNWLRLGRLRPAGEQEGKPCFSAAYVRQLQRELQRKDTRTLKSRRNKTCISGNSFYDSYLPEDSKNLPVIARVIRELADQPLGEGQLREILAECALQLLCQSKNIVYEGRDSYLRAYRRGELALGEYAVLIQELLEEETPQRMAKSPADFNGQNQLSAGKEEIPRRILKSPVNSAAYHLEPGQDVLGMLYLSLRNLGGRKAAGAYYTPAHIVKRLTDDLLTEEIQSPAQPYLNGVPSEVKIAVSGADGVRFKILDPCCGTGNFLLQLAEKNGIESLYGRDIDPLAVQLARINLALADRKASPALLRERIRVEDFLFGEETDKYDIILGNPPWGSSFSLEQKKKLREKFQTGTGKSVEAYELFIEQSLRRVKQEGFLAFVLPEAVLQVKAHEKIRELLSEQVQFRRLDYLGNVFDKVQCPAVILQMQKTGTPLDTAGMKVREFHPAYSQAEFEIHTSRPVKPERFDFYMTDEEYLLVSEILQRRHMTYLKGQADFALGIVTGNNSRFLQADRNGKNEMVLKGCDIRKYGISRGKQYLSYEPEQFQQTAPERFYRAEEKLVYRFIGKELVFAYDDTGCLSLNSCNILIPRVERLDMKYILAVLNSRTAQFLYERRFRSVKVLRSYLEQLPIPVVSSEEQREILILAEKLMEETKKHILAETLIAEPEASMPEKKATAEPKTPMLAKKATAEPEAEVCRMLYEEIDKKIASAYGLTEAEYDMVCNRQR